MPRESDDSIKAHMDELSRLAGEYVDTWRSVSVAGYLPGADKRAQLEQIAWNAVLQMQEIVKTEEAASHATSQLLAFRVFTALVRTELAILHDVDDAFVEELIEEIQKSNESMKKDLDEFRRNAASGLR